MGEIKLITLILAFGLPISRAGCQTNEALADNKFHSVNSEILQLFKQYPIVAIGEGQHNSALTFEWLSTLINEKEFPGAVRNIVVEFGASEYQWVMDDFVNNKDVADSLFKKCWRETTQIMVWDNPIYEQFFREVRKRNIGLPGDKRIRVLLGDPSFGSKEISDEHCFRIIEKEVLGKNQTALLIFGDLHFVKKDVFTNFSPAGDLKEDLRNVIQFLEINYPGKTYCIWGSVNTNDSLTNDVIKKENIQVPSLVRVLDSKLGDIDFRVFYPYPTLYRTDNLGNDIDQTQHIQMPVREIVDGIIYRGSWEAQNYLAPRPDDIYADTVYLNELIRREQIVNIPPYRTRLYFYKIFGSKEFVPFVDALERDTPEIIEVFYRKLIEYIPEEKRMDVLNYTGYYYLKKKELTKAIGIFKLAVRDFPDAFNTYDSLGDAYLANNETEKAIKCFEDALLINPDSKLTRNKLDKLKTKGY